MLTAMLGQVGNDADGQAYIDFMRKEGIETAGIRLVDGTPTGSAYIISQQDGENSIILNGGANMHLDEPGAPLADSWRQLIAGSHIVLLQREIPE